MCTLCSHTQYYEKGPNLGFFFGVWCALYIINKIKYKWWQKRRKSTHVLKSFALYYKHNTKLYIRRPKRKTSSNVCTLLLCIVPNILGCCKKQKVHRPFFIHPLYEKGRVCEWTCQQHLRAFCSMKNMKSQCTTEAQLLLCSSVLIFINYMVM